MLMKRLLAATCALALVGGPCEAGNLLLMGVGDASSGAPPTGVFDATGHQWTHYWSTWAGSTALAAAHTPLINATASNGGSPVSCDILASSTTGGLGNTSGGCASGVMSYAAFCAQGGGTCSDTPTAYDQGSVPINMVNTSAGALQTTCGTVPCIKLNSATGIIFRMTLPAAQAQPFLFSVVALRSSGTSFNAAVGNGGNTEMGYNAANTAYVYCGTTLNSGATVADGSLHALQGYCNSLAGTSNINADGTDSSGPAGSIGLVSGTNQTSIGNNGFGGDGFPGFFTEAGLDYGSWTSTQWNAVCKIQAHHNGLSGAACF
jgi:hypothetical protein